MVRSFLRRLYQRSKNINAYVVVLFSTWRHGVFFVAREKNILIVEPNPYHGEILPGFVRYFQELGYNVDVFMRYENFKEKAFCRFSSNMRPRIYVFTREAMKKMLMHNNIKDYELVFFSSLELYEFPFVGKYMDFLGFQPGGKYGILGVYHSPNRVYEHSDESLMRAGRVFSIADSKEWQGEVPSISPHYFGDVKITDKKNITHFVVIGSLQREVRNHDLLFKAIDGLLNCGYCDFKITIIGRGELVLSEKSEKYVEVLGRVDFPRMFEEIEKSDFILALLDTKCGLHQRYLEGVTSGSKQLTLGFIKPQIIQKDFADAYGFNQSNSIVYDDDNLFEAMEMAIKMTGKEYEIMQTNIKLTADILREKSLTNISKAIERIVK